MSKLKLIFSTLLAMASICASCVFADAMMLEYDGGEYEYNGAVYELIVKNKKVESALEPIIFNDRALVPVREVFEEVGADVYYNSDSKVVEVVDENNYIRMTINDNVAYVNGTKTSIPDSVVPKLISKAGGETKTMVPVRFISETIGLNVDFDGDNGAILVESDSYDKIMKTPTPTQAPTPEPTATPTPEPTAEPTAAPTIAPAAEIIPSVVTISSVTFENIQIGKSAVIVKMDGYADYSYFTLGDPERLVVDISNTQTSFGEQTLYINNGGIKAVRVGVNSERTRVVVDVDKLENYGFERQGNNLIIYARASVSEGSYVVPVATPVPTTAPAGDVTYKKNLIALDAGHGGYDPGAQGTLNGVTINESDLTLQITYKVKEILESRGYEVLMTRTDDSYKTLVERPTLANDNNAALFVSIHINSVDNAPTANGTEVFYAESNNREVGGVTSSVLAKNILEGMIAQMGSMNRGVKTAEHAVTKRSNMPACLAEVGFITNPQEVANMVNSDYQYKVAQGIADGIIKTAEMMK